MKKIKAKLLTCCKGWHKVILEYSDFKFISNYGKCCNNTQIWKGSNGEYFILRDVEVIK